MTSPTKNVTSNPTTTRTLSNNQRLAFSRRWFLIDITDSIEVSRVYKCAHTRVLRKNIDALIRAENTIWDEVTDSLNINRTAAYRLRPKDEIDLNDHWVGSQTLIARLAVKLHVDVEALIPTQAATHIQAIQVVYHLGGATADEADIKDFVRLMLAVWKLPHRDAVDSLPRKPLNKFSRKESEASFLDRVLPVAEFFGQFLNSHLPEGKMKR